MRRDEIRRLREQSVHLLAEARTIHQKAEAEERDLTSEETQEFDNLMKQMEECELRAKRGIELLASEKELEKQLATSIDVQIGDDKETPHSLEEYRKQQVGVKSWDQPEVRAAYWRYLTVGALSQLDVEEQRALSKASGAAGAYLVPTELYDQIIRAIRQFGVIGQLANVITTSSGDTLNVPANTAHGAASWTSENAGFTQSDETFSQVGLSAFKAATSIIISEELLQDSAFPLEGFLAREFGERIGVLENTGFVNGSGTGQPQGILPNLTTVYTAPAGSSTTFKYADLVNGIFTLPPQYRQNASFVVNDGAAKNLYLMVDLQNRPLWNINVSAAGPDTLLGYPVYTDPDMPAPGVSNKSVMFGDWRRVYTIRRVDGFSIQRQSELYSNNGQVGFRGFERVDGRIVLNVAGVAVQHSAT